MIPAAPDRLVNIQALRAIAALMVVAIHIQANELRAAGDPLLSPWLYHGVAGVDLFFVISGFIIVHVTRGRFGLPVNAARFVYDRILRVYPPAILFTALTLLGVTVQGTVDFWLSQTDLLASFLLLPQEGEPLLGVAWTLTHELYFYLVFASFLFLPERFLPVCLAIWAAIIGSGLAMGVTMASNPWLIVAFHPHTYEFMGGAVAALLFHRGWIRFPVFLLLAGIVAMIAGAIWIGLREPETYPLFYGRVIAFGPASVLIVMGIAGMERAGQFKAPNWAQAIGDWSYSLYLSHLLVIAALAHIWMRFAQPGIADNLVMIAGMIIASLMVSAIAFYGFERPTLTLGKRLGRQLFKR